MDAAGGQAGRVGASGEPMSRPLTAEEEAAQARVCAGSADEEDWAIYRRLVREFVGRDSHGRRVAPRPPASVLRFRRRRRRRKGV